MDASGKHMTTMTVHRAHTTRHVTHAYASCIEATFAPSASPALGYAGRVGHMHPRCLGGKARAQCDACVRSRVPHMFHTCSTHVPHMFHCILYHVPHLSRLLGGTPTPLNPLPQRNVEHATNYSGTRVEHVWNMCGTWAEHDAGRRSARIDALEAPRGLTIWFWRLPDAEQRAPALFGCAPAPRRAPSR